MASSTLARSAVAMAAAIVLALGGAANAQTPAAVTNAPGIITVDFMLMRLDPDGSSWLATVEMLNFNPVVGFNIFVYLNSAGNSNGVSIPEFIDLGIPGVDIFNSIITGNSIAGGSLAVFGPFSPPISINPNCGFDMSPSAQLPLCGDADPRPIIAFNITAPPGTTVDDIVFGGPPGQNVESPEFAVSFVVTPPVTLDPSENMPVPTPTPAPARTISDPHMRGFLGQEFEFNGEVGNIYNLITDRKAEGEDPVLLLNALFAAAYTSGVSADQDTLEIRPYHSKGTWIVALGLQILDSKILISCESSSEDCQSSSCLHSGQVAVDDQPLLSTGTYELDSNFTLNLINSRSFSRVRVKAADLSVTVDIVPPPLSWMISELESASYTHINLIIDSITLSLSEGVLGETTRLTHDSQGVPQYKSSGADGEGVLSRGAGGYVVPTLFTPLI